MSAAPLALLHAAGLLLLAASCFGWGRLLAYPVLRGDRRAMDEAAVIASAVGLAWLAFAGLALGLLGLLYRPFAWALLLPGVLFAIGGARLPTLRLPRSPELGVLVLALVPAFALALYPSTAFDATLYHLPTARAFVQSHALVFVSEVRFPVFPHFNEVLFSLALLVGGDATPNLVHLYELLLSVLAVFLLGRRLGSARSGLWAAALWLGNPLVLWQGASATVDVGLSLFCVLAFLTWESWHREGKRSWLVLGALFAGCAAATKYPGLLVVGALTVLTLWRAPEGRRLRALALFVIVTLLVLGPWYARMVAYTGNPLFPFLTAVFGTNPWQATGDWGLGEGDGVSLLVPIVAVGGKLLAALGDRAVLLLPWSVAFDRDAFHHQPPLSPLYLLLLPALVTAARRSPIAVRLLLVSSVWLVAWMALPRYLHYLLPVAAFLAVVVGGGVECLLEGPESGRLAGLRSPVVTALMMALMLAPATVYGVHHLLRRGPVPVTEAGRHAFLERELPGYEGLRWLNDLHGRDYTVYGLWAENLHYYAEGRFLGDWFGPAAYRTVMPLLEDPSALRRRLLALGVDHLLIRRLPGGTHPTENPAFRRCFEPLLERRDFGLYALTPVPRPLSSVRESDGQVLRGQILGRLIRQTAVQSTDAAATGAEIAEEGLDGALRMAAAAEEHVQRDVGVLGPGVHGDVRLGEGRGRRDALRREVVNREVDESGSGGGHRGTQGAFHRRRVVEDPGGGFPCIDDEVDAEQTIHCRWILLAPAARDELGAGTLFGRAGRRHRAEGGNDVGGDLRRRLDKRNEGPEVSST